MNLSRRLNSRLNGDNHSFDMTLADFPALTKLPKRQRLKLAEELWFSGVDDNFPISETHRKILDERWSAYQKGRAKHVSLSELERRLARK